MAKRKVLKKNHPINLSEWEDCEKLFSHLGAQVSRHNSRLRVAFKGRLAIFHFGNNRRPIDANSVMALKKFLAYVGDHEI